MQKALFTVITGASRGLGRSFANICAKKGHNLILISLPAESLKTVAENLREKYKIKVYSFECDLTKIEQVQQLVLDLKNFNINVLINNAGVGGAKKFKQATLNYIDNILLLNMRSLVILTHQLLPVFEKQDEVYILNISSLAAFTPMPYKTIYPASKAFVYSFSRGLNAELKHANIHVAVAHPGPMATNEDVAKRINAHKGLLKKSILSPEKTAEICLNKLFNKQSVIVPGRLNKISSVLQKIMPVRYQIGIIKGKLEKEA